MSEFNVRLVTHTPEHVIGYCARVSNPANQEKDASKLLGYMINNQHWSPFEMAFVVMEIETSRTIARQILRHRSFSFQEFSQRYAEAPDFMEPIEARLQDTKNRQNSTPTEDFSLRRAWISAQEDVLEQIQKAYKAALSAGIAKEVARVILPEGLTQSRLYMAGTLRSWIHYTQLRTANGTQKEHQDIAFACEAILREIYPDVMNALVPF